MLYRLIFSRTLLPKYCQKIFPLNTLKYIYFKICLQTPTSSPMTPDQLRALFYGTPQAYQQYLNIISLQKDNPTPQITQKDYLLYNDYDHSKETKTLLKLLKLHKTRQLNLLDHLHILNNLSLSSSTLEIHFNLFRNICLSFVPPKQIPYVQNLLDSLHILGSVLLHEFNLEACIVEDNVHVIYISCFSRMLRIIYNRLRLLLTQKRTSYTSTRSFS